MSEFGSLTAHLARFGDRPALMTASGVLTYGALADRVSDGLTGRADRRRLVMIETRNETSTLIAYLGALAVGDVVLPVSPGRGRALIDTYRPDVVVDATGQVTQLRGAARDDGDLHPDLALVMSTSGSTGSPKLVRLSHENVSSNAVAIADYLRITEFDCAATTLPMSYCYGLSVVHSHLLAGASLILTEESVIDDGFWKLFRQYGATGLAGVPYTFEMLDRVGFAAMDLPDLRYLTQAGGRLAPDRVRRFADLGAARGWQLYVMYGATEATARMAYLPPDLASTHPESIGYPIPGGAFTLEPIEGFAEPDTGELVYHGPNVMLGYATTRDDLTMGRTVDALRTGDVARLGAHGLYQVIGRTNRFVKVYGLRIDLARVESVLAAGGVTAWCTDIDERLVVAATDGHDVVVLRQLAADAAGVPTAIVDAVVFRELPVLPSGKPDYGMVRAAARQLDTSSVVGSDGGQARMAQLFADVLQIDPRLVSPASTFVGLGGTSLSYVTMSVRLEKALGRLPKDWHRTPVETLELMSGRADRSRRRFAATLETSVALRAVAIVLIVGSHVGLYEMWGGAHILLGVAGYNFGRFCLTPVPRSERVHHLRATIAWIAIPSIVWVAIALVFTDEYHLTNLALANKILGPHDSLTAGRLWFVEVLVYVLIALTMLVAFPAVDRLERLRPFAFAAAFLIAGIAIRYDALGFGLGRDAWFTFTAFWFFAAGWAAAKASATWQRVAVTALLVVCVHGYFGDAHRELLVLSGLALLIWLPAIRCPAALTATAGVLAEASLFTYLTHFQIYPLFGGHPLLGVLAALAVGALLTRLVARLTMGLRKWWWGQEPGPAVLSQPGWRGALLPAQPGRRWPRS